MLWLQNWNETRMGEDSLKRNHFTFLSGVNKSFFNIYQVYGKTKFCDCFASISVVFSVFASYEFCSRIELSITFNLSVTSFVNTSYSSLLFYSVCLCKYEQTNWILFLFYTFTVCLCTFPFRTRMKFLNRDMQLTNWIEIGWRRERVLLSQCRHIGILP